MIRAGTASQLALRYSTLAAGVLAAFLSMAAPAAAQRVLGLDVSRWQGTISQANWNTAYTTGNRQFVFIRSSRGGTTGEDHRQGGYPSGNNTFFSLSERYDDPTFVANMVAATNAGMFAAPYHFARLDVAGNTGTDEANHFIQMAGAWMRPGYLPPMYDLEAGASQRTATQIAQFSLDFSNRIYEVMGIRPSIYINGNYAGILQNATGSLPSQIAQPATNSPSVVSPAYPVLVTARWPNQTNPSAIDIQNSNPRDAGSGVSGIYGPFDNYGVTHPWHFWQYASTASVPGIADTTIDVDVAQGDIEFVKDQLIPAVWMNNSSGNWSTLANWNSGQAAVAPVIAPGQLTPTATGPLPAARLPGAAGSGPTSGQHDTVILERPAANITVSLTTGTHNIRKLYMREALNITGGSLVINYNPNYNNDFDNNPATNFPNALRSGPISAQFSGPVTLGGTGSLNVHTLQVDNTQTFTLAGGTGVLTFNTINLMPGATPAKIAMNGNVNILPLSGATATIANGAGGGSSGFIDLGGGDRVFNLANGAAAVDLAVNVPITNGAITKSSTGTMSLGAASTFTGGVTINGGTLRYGHSTGLPNTNVVTINNGGTLDMNNISDTLAALASAPGQISGVVARGTASLTLNAPSGTHTFEGTITGSGTFTKQGGSTQKLTGNNTLGPVIVLGGLLSLSGNNTTGTVNVNGGALGGTGSVSGGVTIQEGSELTPGASIGTFTAGSLAFNPGSLFSVDLGLPGTSDLVNVNGALTIGGGWVNIADAGGLGVGTYTIIDYGTIDGSVSNFESVTGPEGFTYSLVDTGSTIDLVVALPVPEPTTIGLLTLAMLGCALRRRNR